MLRLSVLEQSIATVGRPNRAAISNALELAKHCESLGYDRFWVSEHHNHATIVGTAPEILIAAIATSTQKIRVGSAGIMLPHYSAFKVAEQFRVLDALAPGRIDLGLGRAPGSDGRTAFALNPLANERPAHLVWTDSFDIAIYPVTRSEYTKFLHETGHELPHEWNSPTLSAPDLPVVGVSWHDAVTYCHWLEKLGQPSRLPTEAEWERAARGGKEHQRYPWGLDHDELIVFVLI